MPNNQCLYDAKWLEEQLSDKKNFLGHALLTESAEAHVTHIINLLKSERSSDDLQSDLLDSLGFDHIDLIQNILEHRSDIVKSL